MSEWFGDKTNGIEIRRNEDGSVDEVILYQDGKCLVHIEQMSDEGFWMSLKAKNHEVHFNLGSQTEKIWTQIEGWRTYTCDACLSDHLTEPTSVKPCGRCKVLAEQQSKPIETTTF